jgi:hypothetical protein
LKHVSSEQAKSCQRAASKTGPKICGSELFSENERQHEGCCGKTQGQEQERRNIGKGLLDQDEGGPPNQRDAEEAEID